MIRLVHITIILVCSFSSSAQSRYYNEEMVECYFDKSSNSNMYLYSEPDGILKDSLLALDSEMCWYRLSISESRDNWFKIESINVMPSCRNNITNKCDTCYTGMWVKSNNLKINIADLSVKPIDGIKFFESPDLKSKVIYYSGKFLSTELIEVKGNWAKVGFKIEDEIYTGWLQKADQCSFPWTSCPKTTE